MSDQVDHDNTSPAVSCDLGLICESKLSYPETSYFGKVPEAIVAKTDCEMIRPGLVKSQAALFTMGEATTHGSRNIRNFP
jgi:hypothetical protein